MLSVLLSLSLIGAEPKSIEAQAGRGYALAVVVDDGPLVHTGQIFPSGPQSQPTPPADQVRQAWARLESSLKQAGSSTAKLVRLHAYVTHPSVTRLIEQELKTRFPGSYQPALTVVETALPGDGVMLAFDAVALSDRSATAVERFKDERSGLPARSALLPTGGVTYISGQAEKGDGTVVGATQATMESLLKTLKWLELSPADVVHVKAFLTPMRESSAATKAIVESFAAEVPPPVTLVEWKSTLPIEIELVVASQPRRVGSPVEFLTPPGMTPSPVFARVTRIHSPRRVYVSGLVSPRVKDAPPDEVVDLFAQLDRVLTAAESDLLHCAKATYYVATDDASRTLNEVRPRFYEAQRPPAASKAMVRGLGRENISLSLDMIAVPR